MAGVNYSDPKPGLEPVVVRLTKPIADDELIRVQAAIEIACEGRDSGSDKANAEHLLQEWLRTEWKPLGLCAAPLREAPVRRPIGYGYIDLVGPGVDGRIHVIETKLGPFDRLVVQGLDYWIWANANRDALAEMLELPADPGIAEALHGAIRWRFTTIRNWAGAGPAEIRLLPIRTLPHGSKGRPAPRKAPPRWPVRLAYHLVP